MPKFGVKVDRTTRWGNPFVVRPSGERGRRRWDVVGPDGKTIAGGIAEPAAAAAAAVELYKAHLPALMAQNAAAGHPISELFGLDLGCWCVAGKPCHVDPLAEAVNGSRAHRAGAV